MFVDQRVWLPSNSALSSLNLGPGSLKETLDPSGCFTLKWWPCWRDPPMPILVLNPCGMLQAAFYHFLCNQTIQNLHQKGCRNRAPNCTPAGQALVGRPFLQTLQTASRSLQEKQDTAALVCAGAPQPRAMMRLRRETLQYLGLYDFWGRKHENWCEQIASIQLLHEHLQSGHLWWIDIYWGRHFVDLHCKLISATWINLGFVSLA